MWRVVSTILIGAWLTACEDPKPVGRYEFEVSNRFKPMFDPDSAFTYLQTQVDFGPRNPGSEGHSRARDWLIAQLKAASGNRVFAQDFTAEGYGETLAMTNIIAAFNPTARSRILLCAHWDTRPRSEHDADASKQHMPLIGANDGASGVAVLLELARLFRDTPPPIGVDIVLFDGEDYGHESDIDKYFLGSRHWSANPPVPGYMPRFGILLDMVGGRGAQFPKEGFSMRYAWPVVEEVWRIAAGQGHNTLFLNEAGPPVADDHMILNQVYGLPTINIIHHPFPDVWHTTDDTIEHIDTKTLKAVGDVLVELIYRRVKP